MLLETKALMTALRGCFVKSCQTKAEHRRKQERNEQVHKSVHKASNLKSGGGNHETGKKHHAQIVFRRIGHLELRGV